MGFGLSDIGSLAAARLELGMAKLRGFGPGATPEEFALANELANDANYQD